MNNSQGYSAFVDTNSLDYTILFAIKTTLEKVDQMEKTGEIPRLTKEDKYKNIEVVINKIINEVNYNGITRDNGARANLARFSPDEIKEYLSNNSLREVFENAYMSVGKNLASTKVNEQINNQQQDFINAQKEQEDLRARQVQEYKNSILDVAVKSTASVSSMQLDRALNQALKGDFSFFANVSPELRSKLETELKPQDVLVYLKNNISANIMQESLNQYQAISMFADQIANEIKMQKTEENIRQ